MRYWPHHNFSIPFYPKEIPPPLFQASWAAAAANYSARLASDQTVNQTALPPACFTFNLLEVLFLDPNGFQQVFFWRGRREPFYPYSTTMAAMVGFQRRVWKAAL